MGKYGIELIIVLKPMYRYIFLLPHSIDRLVAVINSAQYSICIGFQGIYKWSIFRMAKMG